MVRMFAISIRSVSPVRCTALNQGGQLVQSNYSLDMAIASQLPRQAGRTIPLRRGQQTSLI